MRHCREFLCLLTAGDQLQSCMFALQPEDIGALGNDLIVEDEYADFMGQSCLALCAFRVCRNLHMMSGWPRLFLRGCGDADTKGQSDCIALFKSGWGAFDHLQKLAVQTDEMKDVVRWGAFTKRAMIRCCNACSGRTCLGPHD